MKRQSPHQPELPPQQTEWITPKQLESEHGIKISTQAKMRMQKRIPYSKVGKFIRYNRAKIEKMFEDAEVIS